VSAGLASFRVAAFAAAVVAGLSAGAFCTAAAAQDASSQYCSKTGKTVLFLVDITTPYDATDKSEIIESVDALYATLQGGDRLIVRTIADSYTHSQRLIDRCVPYCDSGNAVSRFFECNDGLIRRDNQQLRDRLIGTLRSKLANFHELPYSDIVRTLVAVAREDLRPATKSRIFMFSDLIENSDELPGRDLFTVSNDILLESLQRDDLIAPLTGAEVKVSGVGRAGTPGRRPLTVEELNKLRDFWNEYFKRAGAASVSISQNVTSISGN
jgi:hypothetical protein